MYVLWSEQLVFFSENNHLSGLGLLFLLAVLLGSERIWVASHREAVCWTALGLAWIHSSLAGGRFPSSLLLTRVTRKAWPALHALWFFPVFIYLSSGGRSWNWSMLQTHIMGECRKQGIIVHRTCLFDSNGWEPGSATQYSNVRSASGWGNKMHRLSLCSSSHRGYTSMADIPLVLLVQM